MFISKAMAAFVTVAQEKSLKKTAEKLCLTVPPVSRMLKNTEHWFGEQLIVIERNKVSLTPFGINVYRQILPHYLSLLNISKRKSKAPLTISSPVIHASFFDEMIHTVLPDIPDCPVMKYAEHIREEDDLFVHFSPVACPACFEESVWCIELKLICHDSVKSTWPELNLLVGSELLYSEAFHDALIALREHGYKGEVRLMDNAQIRALLHQSGAGLIFRTRSLKSESVCATGQFSFRQPFYVYCNKFSRTAYRAEKPSLNTHASDEEP
ncbi:helix-turn-helix domain-containing protein [Klebsiella aerogenes]|uniref:helix-turn-helix domain-containing protein n=1 Tax=Klebsiella aerogenes TaxID=548 RepID=UPI001868BC9E|nr:LysR family transcriptional regulator [Klebsiella aerogenes]